ncbi:YopX family protein [Clostridium baratii]
MSKFRAWDKIDEKLWNVVSIDFIKGEVTLLNEYTKESYIREMDEVELMRYTGLKDKNGKEIYEGDILERKFSGLGNELGDRIFVSWDRYRFVQNWVMKFKRNLKNSADLGKWFKSQKQFKLDLDAHLNDFEVVGNIYESPELLKG